MWKKTADRLCPEIHYLKREAGVVITGCYGTDGDLVLPDKIEGLPVVAVADYAFASRKEEEETRVFRIREGLPGEEYRRICMEAVQSIWLPAEITEVGRYAFYRCRNLKKLILTDSLLEIGGGAFTGCRMEEAEIYFYKGEKSCLKSIVDEIRFQIRAKLHYEFGGMKETAEVLFPEHYEEAVENTPARLLVTQHHGAGGYYRQCFYDRKLDYKKYDELLFRTIAEEEERTGAELALLRLRYPYCLTEDARRAYQDYLRGHLKTAAELFIETGDTAGILYLGREGYFSDEGALKSAVECAAEMKETEILSILMDEQQKRFKKQKTFEL